MAYIGKQPTAVPLTSSDITDGIVTTAKIADDAVDENKLDLTADYAFTGTITGAGENNVPAFSTYVSSNQSISNATNTKVNFDTEHFDTDSAYDTTNKRFTVPSGEAGKYFISAGYNGNSDTTTKLYIMIYVNGNSTFSSMLFQNIKYRDNDSYIQINRTMDLSVGDYVEIFVRQEQGSTATLQANGSWFQGFKIT